MSDSIEQIPEVERRKRAGEELAAPCNPYDPMTPSVLDMMAIMRKWNVDSVIWPANMGTNLKAPRKQ